jgi:hypothetical protein
MTRAISSRFDGCRVATHPTRQPACRWIGLRRPNSDIQMSLNIYLRARQINDGEAIVDHRTQQRMAPCS